MPTNTLTPAKTKAVIKAGVRKDKYSGSPKLFLDKLGDTLYATESHFLTPVAYGSALQGLLDEFNLEGEPGTYEVNSAVRKASDDKPDMARLLDEFNRDVKVGLSLHLIVGHPAMVQLGADNALCVVLDKVVDGETVQVAVRAEYVAVICGTDWLDEAKGGDIIFSQSEAGTHKPIGVHRMIRSEHWQQNPYKRVETVKVTDTALVMPFRINA